jgi:hypothetical protein
MLEIHGYLSAAAAEQGQQVESFRHTDFPAGGDRDFHQQNRLARMIAIDLATRDAESLVRAERLVRQMYDLQDAVFGDDKVTSTALRRRTIELILGKVVRESRGQFTRLDARLDDLMGGMEDSLADGFGPAGHGALSTLDLLVRVDICRRDWRSFARHVQMAETAAGVPGAALPLAPGAASKPLAQHDDYDAHAQMRWALADVRSIQDHQPRSRHSSRCGRSAPRVESSPCPG